ncbi:hypothetical protein DFH09DRAFT_1288284 [Mycena vulgaris]|nr:hypothetical protein DFH09DRAFT_1288284 [Mycena vulgaris]
MSETYEPHEPEPLGASSPSPSSSSPGCPPNPAWADLRTQLARIQSEIARQQKQVSLDKKALDALEQEQRSVEDGLALAIYPIVTLPNEITSRIFIDCLPSHGRVRPSPHTAPLILVQICRQWREIALSTCQLWSSIFLQISSMDGDRAHNLLEHWISRAKGHPLSLGLHTNYQALPPAVLALLPSRSVQIKWLELHLIPGEFRQLFTPHTPFPLLHHLAISHPSDGTLGGLLKYIPGLREIRLLGEITKIRLSLPLLTSIEIRDSISANKFLTVLNAYPLLEHLKCTVSGRPSSTGAPKPTTYPQLRSLVLGDGMGMGFYGGPRSFFVLDLLTLPNLRRLELLDESKPKTVLSFLSRSRCVIDHFLINIDDCREKDINKWLQAFPALTSLKLTFCRDVNLLAKCLNAPFILPQLTGIAISGAICPKRPYIDYNLFIEILHHRRTSSAPPTKLRSFRIDVCDQREEMNPEALPT